MTRRVLLMCVALLSAAVAVGRAAEADEMADNPRFKFWANFKPGATSTYTQSTSYSGPEKETVPGGVENKTVTYRLASVTKDKALVLTTVVEKDFLSSVELAPTRITDPAKVKAANLRAIMQECYAREGEEETIKVGS